MEKHSFALCAYGKSPHIEYCIKSLVRQKVKTPVIMCTSTPSAYLEKLADKYNIPYYVRKGTSDIRDDWNFAYNTANSQYVTIAHQDDVYHKDYTRQFFKRIKTNNKDDIDIYYTGYRPLKNGKIATDINCVLRAVLRSPMMVSGLRRIPVVKKMTLALGNSICCPTVTYNKLRLGRDIFTSDMNFNIDWDTFYKIAHKEGCFLYEPKSLVLYRIHDEATSKKFIDNKNRYHEDYAMFCKFWPKWIVKIIMKIYVKAYDTYG